MLRGAPGTLARTPGAWYEAGGPRARDGRGANGDGRPQGCSRWVLALALTLVLVLVLVLVLGGGLVLGCTSRGTGLVHANAQGGKGPGVGCNRGWPWGCPQGGPRGAPGDAGSAPARSAGEGRTGLGRYGRHLVVTLVQYL